jgi:preprotein translocase subunit YajC
VQFNQKLHSSKLYNGFQFTVSALAVFSGSTYNSMKKHQETLTCFVAGTMILIASGLVAIENIKAGDKVISTDPETMETSPKTVLETYIREVTTLVHLTVNGEEIVTTVDHPFYVKNQGFIKAGELIVGDELLDVNGNVLLVENFDVELTDKPVKVYNFQVDEFHTCFVGNCIIWVHDNDCVKKVESGEVELETKKQKGNYGEMKMDEHYDSKGFEKMHNGVESLDDKIHHGIDGVYKNNNPNGQPKYVVAEAKYGSSQLGNIQNSGRQMSDAWISKNLDKVVGPEVADDILTEGYSRELFRVKTSPGTNGGVKATTSVKTIDSKGYVVK